MKVLFVLTYYHPHWTGLTQYAKRVAEGLTKRDFEVRVLTTRHEDYLPSNEIIEGVRVLRSNVWFRLSRTMISLDLVWRIVREIMSVDKVIAFLPFAEVAWAGLWAKLLGKKMWLVHNGDLVLPAGIGNRILEKIYDESTQLAIKLSEGIVIHTEDYAENSRLLSKFRDKWKVILPPIAKMKTEKQELEKLRKKLRPNGFKIVGFAGRFVEEKGFDILLKSIPDVVKHVPNVKFFFAGEMHVAYENFFEKSKELFEKYKKFIISAGRLKLSEMANFYKVCDVFVISSRSDCFPVTQIEAMFCFVPVVVTDIPGARWPVKQTGMGIVVERHSPLALAEGIVEVLNNVQKYKYNFGRVKKIFDYKKSIDDYEKLIKQN